MPVTIRVTGPDGAPESFTVTDGTINITVAATEVAPPVPAPAPSPAPAPAPATGLSLPRPVARKPSAKPAGSTWQNLNPDAAGNVVLPADAWSWVRWGGDVGGKVDFVEAAVYGTFKPSAAVFGREPHPGSPKQMHIAK